VLVLFLFYLPALFVGLTFVKTTQNLGLNLSPLRFHYRVTQSLQPPDADAFREDCQTMEAAPMRVNVIQSLCVELIHCHVYYI